MQAEAAHHALVAAIWESRTELLLSIEQVRRCGDDPYFLLSLRPEPEFDSRRVMRE